MLQYSYYQDQSTAEIEAKISAGRQWLHRIADESTLRRFYAPAAPAKDDASPPLLILVGGQLARPLKTWADDGTKGTWGAQGTLVLVSNTDRSVSSAEMTARTGADRADLLAFDDLAPEETIIPGPPPHPHAMTVLPSVHTFMAALREKTGES